MPEFTDSNVWFCDVVKDLFWVVVSDLDLGHAIPYEGDGKHSQTPLGDNHGGDGVFINPHWLLRMRMEKAEATWWFVRF